jgi:hypothetical protein
MCPVRTEMSGSSGRIRTYNPSVNSHGVLLKAIGEHENYTETRIKSMGLVFVSSEDRRPVRLWALFQVPRREKATMARMHFSFTETARYGKRRRTTSH